MKKFLVRHCQTRKGEAIPKYKDCFVASLLAMTILAAGCAKSPGTVGSGPSSTKKIVLWHWLTDRQDVLKDLAKKYQEISGVEIICELYAPSDAYSQKIMAAGQARALPDIYGILGEKRIFAAFINAGHAAELTSYMQANNSEWKNSFFQKALQANQFLEGNNYNVKPGFYGVPLDAMNVQMVYNKRLFQQAGLDPRFAPLTWQEFIAALGKLKQTGIKGLVSGLGETWLIDCLAHNYAFNIMGEEKVVDTMKGKVPYNDPDWVRVFKLFNELARKQFLVSGVVTMGNKTAEQLFANERAAFSFNGSWCINVYKGMNPNLEYAAMLPPKISNQYPMTIWGGAGSSFLVNNRSKNKDEAVAFLRWLTTKKQQIFLATQTLNLPSNKESLANIPEILSQFADDMDSVTHPNVLAVQENPKVIEAFTKGIQAIIIGAKTPEQIADEVWQVKQRIMQEAG